jgi:hypothetical protein
MSSARVKYTEEEGRGRRRGKSLTQRHKGTEGREVRREGFFPF